MKFISLLTIAALSLFTIGCVTNGTTDSKVGSYKRAKGTGYVTVSKTIEVKGTFDGKNKVYKASSKLGDGSQKEGQKAIFNVRPGATLKNVIIDKNGADGLHVYASDGKTTKILNCEWWSGDNDATVLIKDCYFNDAQDKIIQINSRPKVYIENCYGENFQRFVRTNGTPGSTNHAYRVYMKNVKGKKGRTMLKMSNSKARGWMENIQIEDVKNLHEITGGAQVSVKK